MTTTRNDTKAIIDRNLATVRRFLAGTHSPNLVGLDAIDTTVAPTIVCHGFPGGDPDSHESYKQFFRVFQSSFSDMAFRTEAIVADERFVSARWSIECKFTGPFAGLAPTGQTVNFDGMVLYRLENGLIAETWLHINELALLGQIGALPAQAA